MIDIQDFVEINYGYKPTDMWTTLEFNDWKSENGHDRDWDYPLDEFDIITDNKREYGTNYVPVRFATSYGGYEYRFCEIPN